MGRNTDEYMLDNMDEKKLTAVRAQCFELNDDELRWLTGQVVAEANRRIRAGARKGLADVHVGQKVRNKQCLASRRRDVYVPRGTEGEIIRVNDVSITVKFKIGGAWRISPDCVEPVPEAAAEPKVG